MAKKHSAPKKDNLLLWGIGALILIVIIVIIARGCDRAVVEEETPAVQQEEQQPVITADELPVVLGLEEVNCDESATIGYKKCSLMEDGDIAFTVLHQGGATLLGVQYYLYDLNGVIIGEDAQMSPIEGGAEATLTLPVSKFTGVERVEVRPVMNVNGVDSICKNQRVIQHVERC